MNEWHNYPETKPEISHKWYEVKLSDGNMYRSYWWGVWYQFLDFDKVVAWREVAS